MGGAVSVCEQVDVSVPLLLTSTFLLRITPRAEERTYSMFGVLVASKLVLPSTAFCNKCFASRSAARPSLALPDPRTLADVLHRFTCYQFCCSCWLLWHRCNVRQCQPLTWPCKIVRPSASAWHSRQLGSPSLQCHTRWLSSHAAVTCFNCQIKSHNALLTLALATQGLVATLTTA